MEKLLILVVSLLELVYKKLDNWLLFDVMPMNQTCIVCLTLLLFMIQSYQNNQIKIQINFYWRILRVNPYNHTKKQEWKVVEIMKEYNFKIIFMKINHST